MNQSNRRYFLKTLTASGIAVSGLFNLSQAHRTTSEKKILKKDDEDDRRAYNTSYEKEYLNRVAFPIGGIGAGMFCIEGTGAISHMSVRHRPEMFFEPCMFGAIHIKGRENGTKVLESEVPEWKKFGQKNACLGGTDGSHWGLPRFKESRFEAKFPFASLILEDPDFPVGVKITAWSPFIPSDSENSCLPVGTLEYEFKNTGGKTEEYTFSYNAKNFLSPQGTDGLIKPLKNGFILSSEGSISGSENQGCYAIFTDNTDSVTDHCWFRGFRRDALSILWKTLESGKIQPVEPVEKDAPGASLFVPFKLGPGEHKTIRLMIAWHFPKTNLQAGKLTDDYAALVAQNRDLKYYQPWYARRFKNIISISSYWKENYEQLQKKSLVFRDSFYDSTLPPEVIEAVSSNLSILKSPTILRQENGRLWAWEGCGDEIGSCWGSCTHVWNYAQALPHLFPDLERSFRQTEFNENQNHEGHQGHRANLPVSPLVYDFNAKATDGQFGGIMKVYRDWRISGDNKWLVAIYPKVKASMDYCMRTWDPDKSGIMQGAQLNTYDQAFWGANGFCTSFYLGALKAMIRMGKFMKDDISVYVQISKKAAGFMENELFNGEYFVQKIKWPGTDNPQWIETEDKYTSDELEILINEGPKYQYGNGCLSDGVLGSWMSSVCGLDDDVDKNQIKSHLLAVYKYNFKKSLHNHVNTQRASYATGDEGGLLLCTWPRASRPSLPFYYCDEVWTGIEYQAAAHMMLMGMVNEGLEIIRTSRNRYNGKVRNPFNEYEYGHWYARSLSSYSILQGLTGLRYDAVDKILFIDSKIGDFKSFISTGTGFGTVRFKDGKTSLKVAHGHIDIDKIFVAGQPAELSAG